MGKKTKIHEFPQIRQNIHRLNGVIPFDKKLAIFELSEEVFRRITDKDDEIECVKALIPFIYLFRALGLFPVKVSKNYSSITYVKFSSYKAIAFMGALTFGFLLIESVRDFIHVSVLGSSDSVQIVNGVNTIVYYGHGLAITILVSFRVKSVPDFIKACKQVENMCKKYVSPSNDGLVKKSWAIFGALFAAQAIGEVLYYQRIAKGGNTTTTFDEFLAGLDSTELLPNIGNPKVIGAFTFLAELYCDLVWTFGEHLISILAFIITCYFVRLNHGIAHSAVETVEEIEQLRRDHRSLKDLVELYNLIFSPVLLVTYIGNLGYLYTRLYIAVAQDLGHRSGFVIVESIYAFVYLIAKIFVPTWFGAILHERAHESLDTVHDWPSAVTASDCKYRIMVINRFVSQLVTDPVHFNGSGYFTLTKTFIVTLISGTIGYSVIILQFQQAAAAATKK